MMENRFVATRVESLLKLAHRGRTVVQRFTQAGTLDLRGLRDTLGRKRRSG